MSVFRCAAAVSAGLLLSVNAWAKCPLSAGGTLELRAPAGNILIDTTGVDAVEIEVSNRMVVVQENCGRDLVTVSATMPTVIGVPEWRVRVPRGATLDVSTQGGSIQMIGDTDGRETRLRTSGGKLVAGNIRGNAVLIANEVRAGDIGGNAELRGQGGRLQVGNVGGSAQFYTTGGDIATGVVRGRVKADTGSGSVTIRESASDVVVSTREGHITSEYVRGSFDGKTEAGDIRIEKVGAWIHAVTGVGDIFFRLVPVSFTTDLHVKAESALGDITMYLPEKLSASVDALIDRPAFAARRIFSDFPIAASSNAFNAIKGLIPGQQQQRLIPGGPEQFKTVLGSGANAVRAHTSSGTIRILKGN